MHDDFIADNQSMSLRLLTTAKKRESPNSRHSIFRIRCAKLCHILGESGLVVCLFIQRVVKISSPSHLPKINEGVLWVIGATPPQIIHFRLGFSIFFTNQRFFGVPPNDELWKPPYETSIPGRTILEFWWNREELRNFLGFPELPGTIRFFIWIISYKQI